MGLAPATAQDALSPSPQPPPPSVKQAPDEISRLLGGSSATEKAAEKNRVFDAQFMRLNKPPALEQPKFEPPKETSPIDAWGSIAMIFAGLASTKVRNHASTAMNAAAGALNAIKQKDKDAYDKAYKQWEAATKNALDLAHFQMDAYKQLIGEKDHSEELNMTAAKAEDEAKWKTLSIAFQDPQMYQVIQKGGVEAAVDLVNQRQKHDEDFKLKTSALSAGNQKMQLDINAMQGAAAVRNTPEFKQAQAEGDDIKMQELLAPFALPSKGGEAKALEEITKLKETARKENESANGRAAQLFETNKAAKETALGRALTPRETADLMESTYKSVSSSGRRAYPNPDDVKDPALRKQMIDDYGSYAVPWPTTRQQVNLEAWERFEQEVKAAYPDFDRGTSEVVTGERKKLHSGADQDRMATFTRSDHHLTALSGLIDRLPENYDEPAFNKVINFFSKQYGGPEVTNFDIAREIVIDEVVKAATGSNTGGALADRENLKALMPPQGSKKQLQQGLEVMRSLIGGAALSIFNKYPDLSPVERRRALGLTDEQLREFNIDPKTMQALVQGPIKVGAKTIDIGPNGVQPETWIAPEGAGAVKAVGSSPRIGRSATMTKDGKPVKIRENLTTGRWEFEDGTPVQ